MIHKTFEKETNLTKKVLYSLQRANLSCKSIGLFLRNRSLYRDSRYIEPRYIERLLHGKRQDKNRDRTFLLVIEKTRYIETRYRELRLYLYFSVKIEKIVKKAYLVSNRYLKVNYDCLKKKNLIYLVLNQKSTIFSFLAGTQS